MTQVRLSLIDDRVIEIERHRVIPASSRLFGLLRLLIMRAGTPISRGERQTLLADASAPRHHVRQLLHRLRRIGEELTESLGASRACTSAIPPALTGLLEVVPSVPAGSFGNTTAADDAWHEYGSSTNAATPQVSSRSECAS